MSQFGLNYVVSRDVGRAGESLADGQVATTTGAIYTSDNSIRTMLRSVTFFNTNATTQTLNIYITRSGGTQRQLYQATLAQNQSFDLLAQGEVMSLSPGDALRADTTTTTAVDYFISGVTEDD